MKRSRASTGLRPPGGNASRLTSMRANAVSKPCRIDGLTQKRPDAVAKASGATVTFHSGCVRTRLASTSAKVGRDSEGEWACRLTGTWLAGDPGDVSPRNPGVSHVRVDRTANAGDVADRIHLLFPGAKCAYLSVAGS